MAENIFERIEKKYILPKDKAALIVSELNRHMRIDDYGEHTIGSLYYDTPDFELIRNSVEKPVYKEKLRLRSYGVPSESDMVYLELKKKFKGIVYKRRCCLSLKAALLFLNEGTSKADGQILNEISYFLKIRNVEPKVYIAYDRCAFISDECRDLRITLDKNIRFRLDNLTPGEGSFGQLINNEQGFLMEVKSAGAMPLWLCRLLDGNEIYPSSFSKYGYVYKNYIFKERTGGEKCFQAYLLQAEGSPSKKLPYVPLFR